jgi:hypothetical protein
MEKVTYIQSLEMIDIAAKEDRLYHYNGGQAYIRMFVGCSVLMIIDHTLNNKTSIQLMDGTQYFKEYAGYNYQHSSNLRGQSATLVEWYKKNTQLVELDLV